MIDYRRAFKIACELLNGATLYGVDTNKIFEIIMDKDGVVTNDSYEEYILNHLQELDHGQYAIKAFETETEQNENCMEVSKMKTTEVSIPAVMIRHHRRTGKPGSHTWEYDESILKLKNISSININKREICMENGGMYDDVEPDDLKKIIGYFDDLLDGYWDD